MNEGRTMWEEKTSAFSYENHKSLDKCVCCGSECLFVSGALAQKGRACGQGHPAQQWEQKDQDAGSPHHSPSSFTTLSLENVFHSWTVGTCSAVATHHSVQCLWPPFLGKNLVSAGGLGFHTGLCRAQTRPRRPSLVMLVSGWQSLYKEQMVPGREFGQRRQKWTIMGDRTQLPPQWQMLYPIMLHSSLWFGYECGLSPKGSWLEAWFPVW